MFFPFKKAPTRSVRARLGELLGDTAGLQLWVKRRGQGRIHGRGDNNVDEVSSNRGHGHIDRQIQMSANFCS